MISPGLPEIRNFRPIDECLATGGQPTAEQFHAIKQAAFDLIINLALADSPGAIENEADLVRELGLDYLHIPVDFKAPTLDQLERFFEVMEQQKGKRIFVHCAYNFRVSAFVYLYRAIKHQCSVAEALSDLQAVWTPDETWQAFIDLALSRYGCDH